jgi:hypothetical protein
MTLAHEHPQPLLCHRFSRCRRGEPTVRAWASSGANTTTRQARMPLASPTTLRRITRIGLSESASTEDAEQVPHRLWAGFVWRNTASTIWSYARVTLRLRKEGTVSHKISVEDLDALNTLVQDGLIEVAWIRNGIPSYRLARRHRRRRRTAATPAASLRLSRSVCSAT